MTPVTDTKRPPPPPDARRQDASPAGSIDSRDLLKGARHVVIVHRGQEYRLQVTNAGKLILTK